MTLGQFLFIEIRTHDVERESTVDLWLTLPDRRRQEYERAANSVIAEAARRVEERRK